MKRYTNYGGDDGEETGLVQMSHRTDSNDYVSDSEEDYKPHFGTRLKPQSKKWWNKKVFVILLIILFILIGIGLLYWFWFKDFYFDNNNNKDDKQNNNLTTLELAIQNLSLPNNNFSISLFANLSEFGKPRTIRSILYNDKLIVYVGSSSLSLPYVYALVVNDLDNGEIDEYIIFESPWYSPSSIAISNNNELYISTPNSTYKCPNVHEQVLSFNSSFDRLNGCKLFLMIPLQSYDYDALYNIRNGIICEGFNCESRIDIEPHGTISCLTDLTDIELRSPLKLNFSDKSVLVVAKGIRNSVGMDWNPVNSDLWFTDNGVDSTHDNYPDDTLHRIQSIYLTSNTSKLPFDFGFPYCHGLGSGKPELRDAGCNSWLLDEDIGHDIPYPNCFNSDYQLPEAALGPHSTALGMRFYDSNSILFPSEFENSIIIAERGSSSREDNIGYRVVILKLNNNNNKIIDHKILVDGWLDKNTDEHWGRPVDVEILYDGSVLISDDKAGVIYRLTYNGNVDDNLGFFSDNTDNVNCNYSYATTLSPSNSLSYSPSYVPSQTPALSPTSQPSLFPSQNPSEIPSLFPSQNPSEIPSQNPSRNPSKFPSEIPSISPSTAPSSNPSKSPTTNPTIPPIPSPTAEPTPEIHLAAINLPDGFDIEIYYSGLIGPRAIKSVVYDTSNNDSESNPVIITYVGSKSSTHPWVYAILDWEAPYGIYETERIIWSAPQYSPASIAVSPDNELFIATPAAIYRCGGNVHEEVILLNDTFHKLLNCDLYMETPLESYELGALYNIRRYISFSPTGDLCIGNGIVCEGNECFESNRLVFPHSTIICITDIENPPKILNSSLHGSVKVVGSGIRNSVGFDWNFNNDLIFTDNAIDKQHDNFPDDELNIVYNNESDLNFGFPYCHSLGSGDPSDRSTNCHKWFPDDEVNINNTIICNGTQPLYTSPIQLLGPHVTALAERGSASRDPHLGYRIAVVKLSDDGRSVIDHKIFADGWLDSNTNNAWGRPVDIDILPLDGSLLITDDFAGIIYRITYSGDKNTNSIFDNIENNNNCNFSYVNEG